MRIKSTELKIVQGDITELSCEAIVNAANNELLMGGGVAGIIKKKGGKEIEEEAVRQGPIAIGESIATGAGKLKAKYVIHAATMGMDFETDEDKIRRSCASALECAQKLNVKSIAFPALGCGVGHFPLVGAAKIMTQEVLKYVRGGPPRQGGAGPSLREIIFCLYDRETYNIFDKHVTGYVRHFLEDMSWGPYVTVDAIIELKEGIILIERSNPPFGWALPGGFVDYGESLEEAVVREAKEETNLELVDIRQFHAYSDPNRDPRFHTIGTVFIAQGKGAPKAGDDAQGLKVVKYEDLLKLDYAFDHKKIIEDYLAWRRGVSAS